MERRWIFVGALLALLVTLAPTAQGRGRLVLGHVDIPQTNTTENRYAFYVAGWGLDCDSGTTPPFTTIGFWSLDGAGWWMPTRGGQLGGVWRPDVAAAFGGMCPALQSYTGFALYVDPPPAGRWRVFVAWSAEDGTQYSECFDVTLTE